LSVNFRATSRSIWWSSENSKLMPSLILPTFLLNFCPHNLVQKMPGVYFSRTQALKRPAR
ncbi:MAG: hypothetical protein ACE5JC_03105, partial [Candidatus Zixiibacteriota bacterium]